MQVHVATSCKSSRCRLCNTCANSQRSYTLALTLPPKATSMQKTRATSAKTQGASLPTRRARVERVDIFERPCAFTSFLSAHVTRHVQACVRVLYPFRAHKVFTDLYAYLIITLCEG
uniref:Uncharacterized protein n=1 Tax=Bactrocera dorsalis TaxID=27457 RepID=A0A034WPN1_BACDO